MAIEFRPVDGVGFAAEAASLLRFAWPKPALHYSREYLHWQLAFPGPWPAPAVAAFHGSRTVGFAGATHRRVRIGVAAMEAIVVSFVAVDPQFRKEGIGAGLYQRLLRMLSEGGAPILTYAQSGSGGERAIERAYPEAGFSLQAVGAYPIYGCLARPDAPPSSWRLAPEPDLSVLRRIIDSCARSERLIWSDPSEAQWKHYRSDPRERALLLRQEPDDTLSGAAWIVRAEHAGVRGIDYITSIESVWVDRSRGDALGGLGAAAAQLWPGAGSRPEVIQAPSLCGFEPATLKPAGFRQVAPPFQGYAAALSGDERLVGAAGSNLEVV
jgi:GNAT superfamily N-acetyltransferase